MNKNNNKPKRLLVLLLSAAMVMTTVFSMPISYADEKKDDLADKETMQVGVSGVVDEDADVEPISKKVSDETMYTPLYLLKHGNSRYIDTSKIDLRTLAKPVTIARGIATYNYDKQKEWNYTANSLASMYYEVPVYDIDKSSDYYVAIPNVALNNKEIGTYDFVLGYNNDYGEAINDYTYEDDIMYIKKDVIDHPKNEHALNSDDVVLAMQLNYYFKGTENGEDDMFSKTIPVHILSGKSETPEHKTVKVENIFADESVSFPVGDYDKDKVSVLLNGMVIPIDSNAFDIRNQKMMIRLFIDRIYLYDDHFRIILHNSNWPGNASSRAVKDIERHFDKDLFKTEGSVPLQAKTNLYFYPGGFAAEVWFDAKKR